MDKHRVAITGVGLVTPLGIGHQLFWDNLLRGKICVHELERFDASTFPSRVAAEISEFEPEKFMGRKRLQWTDRFSQFAVIAALLAREDARLTIADGEDVGVYTGSALGGLAYAEEQIALFHKEGLRAVRPLLTLSVFGGAAASNIAIEFGLHGPTIANANSCAAGAIAIGEAFSAIRRGEIRMAIAGGAEAPLAPLTFGAFTVARAMSTRNDEPHKASRPFDRERDGFVMGEGAGMLMLERYEDAVNRHARIYAEIVGYGTTNDAYHMAAPRPDGEETARAMTRALSDANVGADEIEAINAHGSSTVLGDRAEMAAYRRVFGDRSGTIPVTATKGQHGHALGATGSWEIAAAAFSIYEKRLPGTANFGSTDEGYAINCTPAATNQAPRLILKNSSGFGGINAALVLKRVD